MKKMIFYDLDGTIIDTREDIAHAANYMLRQLGYATLPQETIERYVGKGVHYFMEGCLHTKDPKLIERGLKLYREHYSEHMMDHSVLYPGAQAVFDYFREKHQAVLTNKPDPFSTDMLKALGVLNVFCAVVPGNGQYPRKPDVAGMQAVMIEQAVNAEEVLLVGDSPVDYETGKRAAVETALLSHGFSSEDELKSLNPDYLFPDLNAFLQYAQTKGW